MQAVGIDIIEIGRIRSIFLRFRERFLKKVYTEQEIAYCLQHKDPVPSLAARFAAKEAVAKALGNGLRGVSFQDIEVVRDKLGKPSVRLSAHLPQDEILLSLSHCKEYAVAVAYVSP